MKKINSLLFIFMLAGTQLFAQKTLTESFNYSTGSLMGVGTATNGWAGPWNEGLTTSAGGILSAIEGNFGNDVGKTGELKQNPEYTGSNTVVRVFREISPEFCFTDNVTGQEIWVSFYFKNTINTALSGSQSYLQLSDPITGTGSCPMGSLANSSTIPTTLGMNQTATSISGTSEGDLNYILVKLVLDGAGVSNGDNAYMWINYTGSTAPDISTAQATRTFTVGNATTVGVLSRLNLLTYKNRTAYFDKIRVSNTFAQNITGIELIQDANHRIYKSGINQIMVDVNGLEGNCNMDIFDMSGRRLESQQLNIVGKATVNTKLDAGLYLIKITGLGKAITAKINF
jgi:hypothetical protein